MTDPVIPLSGQFLKQVLIELRKERSDIKSRIRYACDSANSEEEIEVLILGTGEVTLNKFRKIAETFLEVIYFESIRRAISDISTMDLYNPTAIPAYITKQDREEGLAQEVTYSISLLASTIKDRNDSVKKIILSRSKGITKLIEDVEAEINRVWIPRIETDIRISSNHAWNAGYYSRVSEYAPFKQWVSASDHDEMNGIIVGASDFFTVPDTIDTANITRKIPGCTMFYPGDVTGNPDRRHLEICFCRIVPVIKSPDTTTNVTAEDNATANEPDERKKGRRKKSDDE